MCTKTLIYGTMGLALLLGLLSVFWPQINPNMGVKYAAYFMRFFDVVLPVLATGALLKYLTGCGNLCEK